MKNEIKLNLLYEYESDEIETVMNQLDSIKKKFEEQSSKISNWCKDKTNKYLNYLILILWIGGKNGNMAPFLQIIQECI